MCSQKFVIKVVLLVLFLISPVALATIYYVAPDGNNLNAGTSWETAFKTINKSIDAAANGDIVEVNEGTYYETVNFDGKAITLRSTDPNNWDVVAATVIDANDFNEAVLFTIGEDSNSVLSGFFVKNSMLAGILCDSSSPTITNCIITGHNSHGVVCKTSGVPAIKNSKIFGNEKDGISIYSADAEIENNWIYNNARGIAFDEGNVAILNNTIFDNTTAGIYNMSEQPFKFVCGTDSHVVDVNQPMSGTWAYCYQSAQIKVPFFMSKAQDVNANFVVITGDVTYQGLTDRYDPNITCTTEENIRAALAAIYGPNDSPYNIPRHLVMGNHDYISANRGTYSNLTPKEAWLAMVQEANKAPINSYQNGSSAYYSFSDKGYHFVLLDFTFDSQGNDLIGSSSSYNYPLHEQEWLREDLNQHLHERTFVFTHYAGYTGWSNIKTILEDANNVEAVFYGHAHSSGYSLSNSIRYYMLEAICTYNASEDPNTTCYAIIDVNENRGFTITGYGSENYSVWAEKSFQLGGNTCASSIENCIVWNNGDDMYNCNAVYSCVGSSSDVGDANLTHNICSDPCFIDTGGDDFHLLTSSPCINVGDPNGNYAGQIDIDGDPRVTHDRVDIGADEYYRQNIYVPDNYSTIQAAIDASYDGDVIILAPDTYTGAGNRDLDFGGKAITIRSENPDDPCVVAGTIIDCGGTRTEPHRGIYFHSGETDASIVEGISITDGYGDVQNSYYAGSAIFCDGSSPTIRKCVFYGNTNDLVNEGTDGVIACYSSSNPLIANCIIRNNSSYYSGAISVWSSMPTIQNCFIYNNNAEYGGAIYFYEDANAQITNCTIVNNSASTEGGGLIVNESSPLIENTILYGNNVVYWSCSWESTLIGYDQPVFRYCNIKGSGGSGSGWLSCLGTDGSGNIDIDPCFVNANANDFHLTSNSSCINNGDPNGNYSGQTDMDDDLRVFHGRVDIGADEYYKPIINVPEDFATIQAAINAAYDGDVIVIASGIYTGSGNRDLDFGGKAITIRSENPDDPCVVANTIIDCDGSRNIPHRGFYFHSGEDSNSVVSGLTITNGYGDLRYDYYAGSAIFCDGSAPTISKCIITGNGAFDDMVDGGGIACYNEGADAKIIDCIIKNNTAKYSGGIDIWGCSATIENCQIYGNYAEDGAGVLFWDAPDAATIKNSIVIGNTSTAYGGGMSIWSSSPKIINCTISKNEAFIGGGFVADDTSAEISNCIIWDNNSSYGSDEIYNMSSLRLSFSHCDIKDCYGSGANWNSYYGTDDGGNIDSNPLFFDSNNNDFHLISNSPCIDIGDSSLSYSGQIDIDGDDRVIDISGIGDGNVDVDMGADEYKPD